MNLSKESWCLRFALRAETLTALSHDELLDFALTLHPNAMMLSPEQTADFAMARLEIWLSDALFGLRTPHRRRVITTTEKRSALSSQPGAKKVKSIPAIVQGSMTFYQQDGTPAEVPRGPCSLTTLGELVLIRWGESVDCAATFRAQDIQAKCVAGIVERRELAR